MNWPVDNAPHVPDDQSSSPLERLTRILEWHFDVPLLDDVCASYCQTLYALREWLMERALGVRIPGAEETNLRIKAMDGTGLERLTLAPETSKRLLRGDCNAAVIEFLGRACEAEQAVAGQSRGPRSLWTALGDRYIPAAADYEPWIRRESGFDPREPYIATRVGSIVIDFLSPYAQGIHGPNGFVESVPSADNARESQKKLGMAVALLKEVGLGIASFVDHEILTLVLRSEHSTAAIGSSSTPEYIGRAVFWNTHLSSVGIADMAEQLLHEAIHCHAYRLELCTPFLSAPLHSSASQRLVSPWSGQSLTVHSYLHASFVWYGLANFWFAALTRTALPDTEVLPHLVQAVRGFMADPLDLLGDARPSIAEPILSALDAMGRSIRHRWGDLESTKRTLACNR